jgi:hypothetical protein
VEKKTYLFIIVTIVIFGIIMSLAYSGILGFVNIMPNNDDVSKSQLLAECGRAASLYLTVKNEINRKNFCCINIDLNNNGIINSDEYCARSYDKTIGGNSAAILCSAPVNYYNNYEMCDK